MLSVANKPIMLIMLSVIRLNVVMLSVIRLNVVMLSVIRLNVFMLSVIRLNVVMLSVMAQPRGRFTMVKVRCTLQSTFTSIPMFTVQATDDNFINILPR
jgi:hypothetical protein